MDTQALELNAVIEKKSPAVYGMLSEKGKAIFFPKKGILAQTAEAKGKKINATIGEAVEDDGQPVRLKSIEKELNIAPNLAFPYAPSTGKPDMRNKWKEMLVQKNPSLKGKTISTPIVTHALTHGLSLSGYLFVNPGDTVIVSDLYWENYNLLFENGAGGKVKTFSLFNGEGMNLSALKEAVMEGGIGKKILVLNFPNNPSGYSATHDEVAQIVKILKAAAEVGNSLVVLIDDAYFGLVYENNVDRESIFTQLCDLDPRILAVKLDGPTKEDYVWGFRVGFMTFGVKDGDADLYGALESKTAGALRGNISSVSHLSQSLLFQAYSSSTYEAEKKEKYELLKSRYLAVKEALKEPKYEEVFRPVPFNSGYFMCVRLKEGIDAEQVRKLLLSDYDTGIVNMAGVLRIAFSCVQAKLIPTLFENLYQAARRVRDGK